MTVGAMQALSQPAAVRSCFEPKLNRETLGNVRRLPNRRRTSRPEVYVAWWSDTVDALASAERILTEARRVSKAQRIPLRLLELDLWTSRADARASVDSMLDHYIHVLGRSYGQVAEVSRSVYSLFRLQLCVAALCGVLCALALLDLVVWLTTGVTTFDPVLDFAVAIAAAALFLSTYLSLVYLEKRETHRV